MRRRATFLRVTLAAALLAASASARTEVPEAVLKVIAAAETTGDTVKTKTVYDTVRSAYLEHKQELDLMEEEARARVVAAEQRKLEARQETSESGFFTHGDGRGEIGAKHSTGNILFANRIGERRGQGPEGAPVLQLECDTALPNDVKDVDTLSRFTLLYDF